MEENVPKLSSCCSSVSRRSMLLLASTGDLLRCDTAGENALLSVLQAGHETHEGRAGKVEGLRMLPKAFQRSRYSNQEEPMGTWDQRRSLLLRRATMPARRQLS